MQQDDTVLSSDDAERQSGDSPDGIQTTNHDTDGVKRDEEGGTDIASAGPREDAASTAIPTAQVHRKPRKIKQMNNVFTVENILGKKKMKGKWYYYIKWKDYSPKNNSYVAEEHLNEVARNYIRMNVIPEL